MADQVFDYDTVFAAMCIMEEIADPTLSDAGVPWEAFRENWGINHLREVVIQKLAPACDKAWEQADKRYEQAYAVWRAHMPETSNIDLHDWARAEKANPAGPRPVEPGCFDYEFVPFWLRECVDWSDIEQGPRVRGEQI